MELEEDIRMPGAGVAEFIVSHPEWELRTKVESSARAASPLTYLSHLPSPRINKTFRSLRRINTFPTGASSDSDIP